MKWNSPIPGPGKNDLSFILWIHRDLASNHMKVQLAEDGGPRQMILKYRLSRGVGRHPCSSFIHLTIIHTVRFPLSSSSCGRHVSHVQLLSTTIPFFQYVIHLLLDLLLEVCWYSLCVMVSSWLEAPLGLFGDKPSFGQPRGLDESINWFLACCISQLIEIAHSSVLTDTGSSRDAHV